MLALTEGACQVIEGILRQSEPGAGVRIAPSPHPEAAAETFTMSVAPGPVPDDQQIDSAGGPVFVDPAAGGGPHAGPPPLAPTRRR